MENSFIWVCQNFLLYFSSVLTMQIEMKVYDNHLIQSIDFNCRNPD